MENATPHYVLLDGLRGVAALSVLVYHLFEGVAFAAGSSEQMMFHGFLAVDFFLILSGFVMGHAYDSRWHSMSFASFARRRLIRLHPMVILGVIIGLIVFLSQGAQRWDGTTMPPHIIALGTLLALLLLPSPAATDLRGNTEMFSLNGPHWSLFYEYLFNVIYALLLRRLATRWLRLWLVADGIMLLAYTVMGDDGTLGVGWSSSPLNMLGGLLRVGFDYPMGLLLARRFSKHRPATLSSALIFPLSAIIVVALLSMPSLHAFNPYYELCCTALAFPLIIWTAARAKDNRMDNLATSLGDISYPLYAIHYPLIYLYIGWLMAGSSPFGNSTWLTPTVLGLIAIIMAALATRYYDKPIRRWLAQHFNKE
ncbi:MAG: acyltransferase [Bacteroidales bacterium]|nr:acyltransferase [Bacteroidales bacterium]